MERSRSKRNYYYDQDYDSETVARTRPRYNHHYSAASHRHRGGAARHAKTQDSPLTVTTSYRILCHDMKAGGVIGKSGSIIKLVVSRMHVGCLLGKGGKIIEQMRMETKTQIRILPRDHNLPRCVSMSEEIVQVVGDVNAVKNALLIISSRLRESQHRDRGHFHGRVHSPERLFSPEDDYIPHVTSGSRRSSVDGASFGSRASTANSRNNNHPSLSYAMEPGAAPVADDAQGFYGEELVFRVLCPVEKVDRIIGETDGIVEFLQNEVGVDVKVTEPVGGSDEQIIIVTSEEGPDDELFPAQEALLHIQTRIADLVLDKDNTITTRLVIPSSEIECLDGKDASLLEIRRLTGANIQILPRDDLPLCLAKTDELVQIVGEIKAARDAVVEVTSRLRSYLYRDFFQRDTVPPPAPLPGVDASSSNNVVPVTETPTTYQNVQTVAAAIPSKEVGGSGTETGKPKESDRRDDVLSSLNRIAVPLVTRSTLEVVIPEYAVPKLTAKSKKLAQISELSGANVTLVEGKEDVSQKTIQISGTPEQAERAQSLLQGFILSTQEDGP
uniref:KH domain-containing protein At4g18375 family n=1 Tax=Cajanus cajan TaxID=3821 RepID=A0A151T1N4_CAJCA|nr:KH domain-containing protein At4g18375 family [Cajanus cajan]